MAYKHIVGQPGLQPGTFLSESGELLIPPADWVFLKAGDAAITRNVKARGVSWVVQVRKGRRVIGKGIWAKEADIQAARQEVAAKRATPAYNKRRQVDLARRAVRQEVYEGEFHGAVLSYLNFHARYDNEARILAEKITVHATPIGSGTVARTTRIPLADRAEAAVIAWMRHKTTAYDSMCIARIKGKRREVRRRLAAKSIEVLQSYRQGRAIAANCPLQRVLSTELH